MFLLISAGALAQDAPDTAPPSVPTGLSATQAAPNFTDANLQWDAATDNVLVTGYQIFVDGSLYGTTTQVGTAAEPFQITGIAPPAGYYGPITRAYIAANR